MYGQYDADTELVWRSLLKQYNQMSKALGVNDSDIGHTGSRNRQREWVLDRLVPIDRTAYNATFNRWIGGEDGSDEQLIYYTTKNETLKDRTQQTKSSSEVSWRLRQSLIMIFSRFWPGRPFLQDLPFPKNHKRVEIPTCNLNVKAFE